MGQLGITSMEGLTLGILTAMARGRDKWILAWCKALFGHRK